MTQERSTALALPTSLEEVRGMAEAFIKSGMFSDTKQLSQAIVKIQAGRELGLPPVYSMQNINLIRDRLTTSANTMAMLVKRSGKYNYRIGTHTDIECKIEFFEDGKTVGWSNFTMDDAKRANLVKPDSGWMKFPRAMLFSRAISQGARIYCPDAIGGIYTDEEIRSIPPRPEDKTSNESEAEPPATVTIETTPVELSQEALPAKSRVAEKETSGKLPDDSPLTPDDLTIGFVNLVWLKESLETLQGKGLKAYFDTNMMSYLNAINKEKSKSISEACSKLSKEQATAFEAKIKDALEMV